MDCNDEFKKLWHRYKAHVKVVFLRKDHITLSLRKSRNNEIEIPVIYNAALCDFLMDVVGRRFVHSFTNSMALANYVKWDDDRMVLVTKKNKIKCEVAPRTSNWLWMHGSRGNRDRTFLVNADQIVVVIQIDIGTCKCFLRVKFHDGTELCTYGRYDQFINDCSRYWELGNHRVQHVRSSKIAMITKDVELKYIEQTRIMTVMHFGDHDYRIEFVSFHGKDYEFVKDFFNGAPLWIVPGIVYYKCTTGIKMISVNHKDYVMIDYMDRPSVRIYLNQKIDQFIELINPDPTTYAWIRAPDSKRPWIVHMDYVDDMMKGLKPMII